MTAKKRIRPWAMVVVTLVAFVLMGASGVLGAKIKEFTADNVTLDANGKVLSQGKMYMGGDKMRTDITMGRTSKKMVMIYRRDKKELWALNPEKKIYVQMPLDDQKWEQEVKGMVKSENTKALGEETVNGYRCVKKEVTRKMEVMGMKMTTTQTIWVSDKLGMPIRTRTQDGTVTELRNIKMGKPAAKNFNIPAGYKKVGNDMGALFMSMHGGQMPAAGQQSEGQGGMQLPFKLPKGMKLPFGSSN